MRLVSAGNGRFTPAEQELQAERGDLVIRVMASSVSPRDLRIAGQKVGFCPGADFAGIVETAAGRRGPQAGDRVMGVLHQGAWSERIAVPARAVSPLPDGIGFAEAAAIGATGLTALLAVEQTGPLLGRSLLVTAASGTVGALACQVALAGGAKVTGWSRSPASDLARTAPGVTLVSGETVADAGRFGPFDAIIDMVGGALLAQALPLLAPGGSCVVVGNASGEPTSLDAAALYMNRWRIAGFALFPALEATPASEALPRLLRLVQAGAIALPPIQQVPFREFADAADLPRGKVVLDFGG